jgi:hypothetical protein
MLIVEDTVIDVDVEMIRFPVYVVLRNSSIQEEETESFSERYKPRITASLKVLFLNLAIGIFLALNLLLYIGTQMKVFLRDGTRLDCK